MGECPQLRTLLHSSEAVSAQQLNRVPQLLTLRDQLCAALPLSFTLLTGLTGLARLQHLHLSQCALLRVHATAAAPPHHSLASAALQFRINACALIVLSSSTHVMALVLDLA